MDFGRSKSETIALAFAYDVRRWKVLDEMRRDAERAVPRAAAAVRNRERLVRVEVHEIESHVAGARVAHERVRVRAVVVH